jgi:hypothetical protein
MAQAVDQHAAVTLLPVLPALSMIASFLCTD